MSFDKIYRFRDWISGDVRCVLVGGRDGRGGGGGGVEGRRREEVELDLRVLLVRMVLYEETKAGNISFGRTLPQREPEEMLEAQGTRTKEGRRSRGKGGEEEGRWKLAFSSV